MGAKVHTFRENPLLFRENPLQTYEKSRYFVKDYSWENEVEFRIIIVNKKSSEKYNYIYIHFPELKKGKYTDDFVYRIYPSSNRKERERIEKELLKIKGIENSQIVKSKISIDVNMFIKNRQKFLSYLITLKDSKDEKDIKYLDDIKSIVERNEQTKKG